MKYLIILIVFFFCSTVFAKEPYIWVTSGFSSQTIKMKGELTKYIEKLIDRIESNYGKENIGLLEGFYNYGSDEDYSKFYPVNTSKTQIETGDLIIHFSGLAVSCNSKMYVIFVNYFIIDGCNLWAWVTYDNVIFYSNIPEECEVALNSIYDDIARRINIYKKQNLLNNK